jgi:hypothetical protein
LKQALICISTKVNGYDVEFYFRPKIKYFKLFFLRRRNSKNNSINLRYIELFQSQSNLGLIRYMFISKLNVQPDITFLSYVINEILMTTQPHIIYGDFIRRKINGEPEYLALPTWSPTLFNQINFLDLGCYVNLGKMSQYVSLRKLNHLNKLPQLNKANIVKVNRSIGNFHAAYLIIAFKELFLNISLRSKVIYEKAHLRRKLKNV